MPDPSDKPWTPDPAPQTLTNCSNAIDSHVDLVEIKGERRVDTRILAERLQNQHKPVIALIDKYLTRFERFGQVLFQKAVGRRAQGGGNAERYALLNEDQSYFLLSLARNTDHVVDLKANLVAAFSEARKSAGAGAEYLPSYHALHDKIHALAEKSSNAKFVHMNFNKLINKTIGVESGERHGLPLPRFSLMVVAQAAATNALQSANDHHDGYALAKGAMESIRPVAAQLASVPAARIA